MKNLLNKVWNKEEGFTLIELIIVIAILAIIAAIAIPNVISAVDSSRKTTDISNAKLIADAAATVRAQNEDYTGDITVTIDASTATDSFGGEVVAQLNGVAPTIKYKGTPTPATAYQLVVDASGNITVNAIASGATYELFPNVATPFQD